MEGTSGEAREKSAPVGRRVENPAPFLRLFSGEKGGGYSVNVQSDRRIMSRGKNR
jgi:hypothetical protein